MDVMDQIQEEIQNTTVGQIWQVYKIPILIGSISVIFIGIALVLLVKSTQTATPIKFSSDTPGVLGQLSTVTIDIEGGVVRPGVYTLPFDAIIDDAIASAGGFTDSADLEYVAKVINRAGKVVDGGKIYIPTKQDTTSYNNGFATSGQDSVSSQNQGSVVAMPGMASQNGAFFNLISINTASFSELDSLPGIGPVTATKIISNRPYQTLEELVSRKVVGKSVYGKIKEKISL
jgi:DNA uptake protein ComE-like DNA-binding protein